MVVLLNWFNAFFAIESHIQQFQILGKILKVWKGLEFFFQVNVEK